MQRYIAQSRYLYNSVNSLCTFISIGQATLVKWKIRIAKLDSIGRRSTMIKKLINIRTMTLCTIPSPSTQPFNAQPCQLSNIPCAFISIGQGTLAKWKIRIAKLESIDRSTFLRTSTFNHGGKNTVERFEKEYIPLPICYLRRPFDNLINSAGTKPCRVLDRIARWSNWHSIRIESGVYTGFDPDPWIRQHAKRSGDASITSERHLSRSPPPPPSPSFPSHPFLAESTPFSFFERLFTPFRCNETGRMIPIWQRIWNAGVTRVWEIVSLIKSISENCELTILRIKDVYGSAGIKRSVYLDWKLFM